jgi:hypothetical protein
MFRKILTAGIASVGLALPMANSTPADAHDHHHHHHHHHVYCDNDYFCCDYVVFYRCDCYSPWVCYGRFESEWSARRAVRHLEYRGYESFMRAQ